MITMEDYYKERLLQVRKVKLKRMKQLYSRAGHLTEKDLREQYRQWDYAYKPSESDYISEVVNYVGVSRGSADILEDIECARAKAYYSNTMWESDRGFNRLACLIYFASVLKIETPYDHVLQSNKDFEYKLNNLHPKRN